MWIKLISPKVSLRPMDSAWKRQMSPPLQLLVLSSLTPPEHKITMSDENTEKMDLYDNPDAVGITVKVDTFNRTSQIASHYRKKGIPVILGGIHATAVPEDCAKIADSIVIGEAENLWETVLKDLEKGDLKKVYKADAQPEISSVPLPDWSILKEENYLFTNTLRISRGCPWKCDFCYNSAKNIHSSYRMKPIDKVINEIKSLGTKHIMFIDDNFIGNPKKAKELLLRLRNMDLTWHTAVSADIIRHEDILDLMSESGCKSLFIGFESINRDNLESCLKKQNKVENYEKLISKIHERNMMVNASVVFGFDNDTPQVFPDTLEWLIRNRVETMTGHILTPYPGTSFYDKLIEEGRIFDHNMDHYNTANAVFRPRKMTPEELEKGYLWIYSKFYSWQSIIERCPSWGSGQILAYLQFAILYRKFGKLTSKLGEIYGMRKLAKFAKNLAYGKEHKLPITQKIEDNAPIKKVYKASGI